MEDKVVKFIGVWAAVAAFCTVIGAPALGIFLVGPLVAAATLGE